jgi:hypothetical protein
VLRRFVQIANESPGLSVGHPLAGVYLHSLHCREVDYHAGFAHTEAESTVASSADRQRQMLGLGKLESSGDIGWTSAAYDHCGVQIEGTVEN